MKKIYLHASIFIILNFQTQQCIISSQQQKSLPPFSIPIQFNSIDYQKAQLSLCPGYYKASEKDKLSIVSKYLTLYLQCPFISQYDYIDRLRIETQNNLIRKKINELQTNSFKIYHHETIPVRTIHECILIKRLYDLQKYKESTHEIFLKKVQSSLPT